jgi:uncharacterized protein YpiB (UPF0302 family)
MSKALELSFYKTKNHYSYKEALDRDAVFTVSLDYAEAHKGLAQSAVYDAIVIVDMVKRCFGIDEALTFVLCDGDAIIDAG